MLHFPTTVIATAYCLRGTTADGSPVSTREIAVDPTQIPLGTTLRVTVLNQHLTPKADIVATQLRRPVIARDTGSFIIGRHIDIWTPSCANAKAWGVKTVALRLRRSKISRKRSNPSRFRPVVATRMPYPEKNARTRHRRGSMAREWPLSSFPSLPLFDWLILLDASNRYTRRNQRDSNIHNATCRAMERTRASNQRGGDEGRG